VRKGDVKRSFSNTTKAQNLLQWKAQVDLKEGLETTIGWFLAET
jgi:UDP-glucose 4-epimerase